jgi:hypothetical protein
MGLLLLFPKATPVPLRRRLRLHSPHVSPVDEVLDGLGSALGRWLRARLKRPFRTG